MEKITNEELLKVNAFINSCNDMIHGKFILADIKILKILNMIADSEALYRYIQHCLIDFNFEREYNKAEVQNRFNNGTFVPPTDKQHLVAMVFSLLVEFDKKQIDFYNFINTNFATLTPGGEYDLFAKTLLVPFRDAIASEFGLLNIAPEKLEQMKTENGAEKIEVKQQQEQKEEPKEENEKPDEKIWKDLPILVESMQNCVLTDRKIKGNNKEYLNYILKSINYASKYKDMRLISALLCAVDALTIKSHNIRFIISDLKNEISAYYEQAKK